MTSRRPSDRLFGESRDVRRISGYAMATFTGVKISPYLRYRCAKTGLGFYRLEVFVFYRVALLTVYSVFEKLKPD